MIASVLVLVVIALDQSKPESFHFGGSFVEKKKKAKQSNPAVVESSRSLHSCCSSEQGDHYFVTCGGDSWLCSLEKCKVA